MSEKQSHVLPETFNKNPELKAKLEAYLNTLPEAQKKAEADLVRRYVLGELTWAEIKEVPPELLKQMARVAYTQYKSGDYKTAELLFKTLSIIDHHNWYYRLALGTIFQKKGQFDQAIEEFNLVQQIHPQEVTSLVNLGICYAKLKDFDQALENFASVTEAPLDADHPWVKKARLLSQAILSMKK